MHFISPSRLPRLRVGCVQVGDIFQEFSASGSVDNVIRLGAPLLLRPAHEGGGVALRVRASFQVRGPRTVAFDFQEVRPPGPLRRWQHVGSAQNSNNMCFFSTQQMRLARRLFEGLGVQDFFACAHFLVGGLACRGETP